MTVRKNQLKTDYLATHRPLAKAVKLDQREDGFDGALVCEGIVMTPEILVYRQPDGTITRELRSEEEIRKMIERETMAGMPFTNDHPPKMLTAQDAAAYAKGNILGNGKWMDGENEARARFVILDADTVRDFEDGKRCLSVGVYSDDVLEPGVWNGQPYDLKQENLRLNHLALVDAGRHSKARARMDSADTDEDAMEGKEVEKSDMDYEKMMGALEGLVEMIGQMKGSMDGMMERMDAMMQEKPDVKEEEEEDMDGMYGDKMDAAVSERIELIMHLGQMQGDNFKMDEAMKMDSTDLRRAIVSEAMPGLAEKAQACEGAKLDGLYMAAVASVKDRAKVDASNATLANGMAPKYDASQQGSGHGTSPTAEGRQAWLQSIKGGAAAE